MASTSTTFVAGPPGPTAAQVNGWAQGTLGYAQVTANQGSITTTVDLTSLTVTTTLVANRRIRITGSVIYHSTVAADRFDLMILDGAAVVQTGTVQLPAANVDNSLERSIVITPSAGSHTFKLQGARSTGSGTGTMVATATAPAFILVEDIGAV